MREGSIAVYAKAGLRGARISWVDPSPTPSSQPYAGPVSEVLVNNGVRDIMGHSYPGLRFQGWRCPSCKIVAFSYPQGTDHW